MAASPTSGRSTRASGTIATSVDGTAVHERSDAPGDDWNGLTRTRFARGLHATVVNSLGRDIAGGVLREGEVINPEQVSERFAVSRSVVRESLRALESLGLVQARPQVGTKVLGLHSWDLLNPQVVRWRAEGPDYLEQTRQLFEVRRGIELAAAFLASSRMSVEATDAILSAVDGMEAAYERDDEDEFIRNDVEFHRLLLEGSGNPVISQFAETVAALLKTRHDTGRSAFTDGTPLSIRKHHELAQAIRSHDASAAQDWALAITTVFDHGQNEAAH
ncbi:FCD domain-containing protein [Galbitalea sp. SE-J8]|uniref:FadR/GntR family transcriptional regulator n=1 Tax=Galbitalea sp. SE-J8 TaxID=3054952 RepID=UPI00259C7FD9|nr:FCD domain-containing protein [Galbitalea sp. SE-J8]MDM4762991.1 FCD domain-containing protein [Galbitalea sp. SE-J8]